MSRPAYAAIYSTAPFHRKFRAIPEQKRLAAFGFWVAAIALCELHRSNGFIPHELLPATFPCTEQQREHLVELLLGVGLLDSADGGVVIHDYLEWNRSADDIERGREGMAAGGRKSGQTRRKKSTKVASEGGFGRYPEREEREERGAEPEPSGDEACSSCGAVGEALTDKGVCWPCEDRKAGAA